MLKTRKQSVLLIVLALLITQDLYASQADVEFIPADKYLETTVNAINQAKESIMVTMYLISIKENEPGWPSYKLVGALIKAKERGVKVEVILDQNYDFVEGVPRPENLQVKNMEAYDLLKKNNIPVSMDTPETYTHSKVVVIDEETVILGSTNWSNAALTTNNEANVLIHSKEIARVALEDRKKIQTETPEIDSSEMVPLSWEFTNRKEFLGQMVNQGDERAFDTYLYILKEYNGNPEANVIVNHDNLAKALGIDHMPNEAYRRQIIKTLEKLKDEYKLIDVTTEYGKDSQVILKDYSDPTKLYITPKEKVVYIPKNYWNYGWDKTLKFSGKVMYLINLSYAAVSPQSPRWFSTVETLSKRHYISRWFISDGTMALRKADLVEVQYDEIGKEGNPARLANIYLPNPLYDQVERKTQFEELEKNYGKEKYTQAREYAELVYEDNSLSGVKSLLELEKQYGPEIVKKAVDVVSVKSPDNPKRSMGYLISTIKGMALQRTESS